MTRRFSISVPDEIGAVMDQRGPGNVSGYVADLVRKDNAHELTRRALTGVGIDVDAISPQRRAAWRERLSQPLSPDAQAASAAWLASAPETTA